jgi:hypothetical protein
LRWQKYKKLTTIKYKLLNLDTYTLNILYSPSINNKLRLAIENVFNNFYDFLKFNKYEIPFHTIQIGLEENDQFKISHTFQANLLANRYHHETWFSRVPLIIEEDSKDFLGTCFYMINCLQEYEVNKLDALARFDHNQSYQFKFDCAEENLVLSYFQEMAIIIFGTKIPLQKSQFILSHDIDFINSSWKDTMKKQLKSVSFFEATNTYVRHLKGNDDWQNIDAIIADETSMNIPSIFFWLCKSGKSKFKNIKNADYKIEENYVQACLKKIEAAPLHRNGLHKSISDLSLDEELAQLPQTKLNRYHYLKFNILDDFQKLSASNIEEDHSLGFSEIIGFRNSYGLPFTPFNPFSMSYYNFKAYPLHIMDSSLFYYMGCKTNKSMLAEIESFIEKNEKSAVISILWHNNFYKRSSYLKLLELIKTKLSTHKN